MQHEFGKKARRLPESLEISLKIDFDLRVHDVQERSGCFPIEKEKIADMLYCQSTIGEGDQQEKSTLSVSNQQAWGQLKYRLRQSLIPRCQ